MHPILLEIQAVRSGDREVKSFAGLLGAVSIVVGLFLFWKGDWTWNSTLTLILSAGAAVVALGRIAPFILRPVYRVWMGIAVILGFVMTRVILSLVFYLTITPIGLLFRLIGKDPMHRRPDPGLPTYWISREDDGTMKDRMTRYF